MSKHHAPTRTLIVQPDDTVLPVLGLIGPAARSIAVKQFTLDEPRIVQALIDAHRRGVAVRVMLNPHRSSGSRANDDTYAALEAAAVQVQWTNPAFAVTHEKSMVVDGERALVATFNFSGKYFTQTRDYGVVTTDPAQVAQIAQGFEADWARAPFSPDEQQQFLYVVDSGPMRIVIFDRETMTQIGVVGSRGANAGEFDIVHHMAVDSNGNLYTAEIVTNRRAQKFVPTTAQ